ncbi:MAG: recombinase family protein [Anaerolineae bacterium]
MASRVFLQGPAGSGRTTYAIAHIDSLLKAGVAAESILVLVPQRVIGRPYQVALHSRTQPSAGGDATIVTLSGLARRNVERFWPLVAGPAGFDPSRVPIFLTIETAQYYMMRFARPAIEEGVFDSISLAPPRIAAQLLDNMAKAAIAGFPFEEVADRLIAAWGERHSSRLQVYRVAQELGEAYRAYCRQHNLLDYALQLEVFMQHVLPAPVFQRDFTRRCQHLVAEDIEEMGPLVHDFILAWWNHWETALLVYDPDGGYRTFLGADPDNAYGLAAYCDEVRVLEETPAISPDMVALGYQVQSLLGEVYRDVSPLPGDPMAAISYGYHTYYPQMIDWVAQQVVDLVERGVPAGEIVILAPFLSDALRFALRSRLDGMGIPTYSHRPSRALRDEASARALLTLLALAHPQWGLPPPPRSDVADMLVQVIEGLDPLRAKLLADIVYKPQYDGSLSSFEQIQPTVRERITYRAGERYEHLRHWLLSVAAEVEQGGWPPDYFLSRLFGEVLSQSGFGFHADLDSGRIAAQVIESARKFRQVLYPHGVGDWNEVGREYLQLVNEGVLAALYTQSWQDGTPDAVFIAPAFTFLMRNRQVDYQFWLDIGSQSWWERLDQPLTHPYVLMRHYPAGQPWTDVDEFEAQRRLLYRVTLGLIRRCRRRIYLGISDLGEQGFEQRGPLLYLFQQILGRQGKREEHVT